MSEGSEKKERIVIFYEIPELDVKDVEKEVNTKDNEHYHIFFFHNVNLHFNKTKILRDILIKKFDAIEPEMEYFEEENVLVMTKLMPDVSFEDFDQEVDEEYEHYLTIINYRIDCIFQTFSIFNKLYSDKTLVFYFPIQLYTRFEAICQENEVHFTDLLADSLSASKYDLFYWAGYFSRIVPERSEGEIKENNLVKMLIME